MMAVKEWQFHSYSCIISKKVLQGLWHILTDCITQIHTEDVIQQIKMSLNL